jgi:hypothetical protein
MFKREAGRESARLHAAVSYMVKTVSREGTNLSLCGQKTEGLHARKSENINTFCLWMPEYQKGIETKACVREWEVNYQVHMFRITSQMMLATFTC